MSFSNDIAYNDSRYEPALTASVVMSMITLGCALKHYADHVFRELRACLIRERFRSYWLDRRAGVSSLNS